jgi:hypothetical protein
MAKDAGIEESDEGDMEYDPVWENAMQTTVDPDGLGTDNIALTRDTRATRDAERIILHASNIGFYSVQNVPSSETCAKFGQRSRLGDEEHIYIASVAAKDLFEGKGLAYQTSPESFRENRGTE